MDARSEQDALPAPPAGATLAIESICWTSCPLLRCRDGGRRRAHRGAAHSLLPHSRPQPGAELPRHFTASEKLISATTAPHGAPHLRTTHSRTPQGVRPHHMITYYLATVATISFLVFINASQGVILEDMGIQSDSQGAYYRCLPAGVCADDL